MQLKTKQTQNRQAEANNHEVRTWSPSRFPVNPSGSRRRESFQSSIRHHLPLSIANFHQREKDRDKETSNNRSELSHIHRPSDRERERGSLLVGVILLLAFFSLFGPWEMGTTQAKGSFFLSCAPTRGSR